MRVDVYHHFVPDESTQAKINEALTLLQGLNQKAEKIMADTQKTLDRLAAANASLDGIQSDITALKALVAAGGTPQEIADAVNALADKAAGIDSQTT